MLAELTPFEEETTIVMRSGVQFLDIGLTLDVKKEVPGLFVRRSSGLSLLRLDYDGESGNYHMPDSGEVHSGRALEVAVADSVRLLEGVWVPVPYLRLHAGRFSDGPLNWARARLVTVEPHEDPDHTHRLILSFDTRVDDQDIAGAAYLAPRQDDITAGGRFALAWHGQDMGWFQEQAWVSAWLAELHRENGAKRMRMAAEDIDDAERELTHLAHYLNILWLIGAKGKTPRIRILGNGPDETSRPIDVDLVLDVGNSRTFGLMVESHPQESDGLKDRYVLQLRDLLQPQNVCREPFESRVEFAEATFGKLDHSCQSGRADAFVWPTIARVGPEASRLAAQRRGTEGSTGLSSPKRYLWDEAPYLPGWRFNTAFGRPDGEPHATAQPFGDLIDDLGEALYTLPPEQQMPVFTPHYSRSSLMTFMLAEVLAQALMQMNSPGQRMRMKQAHAPRRLASVILTVPPSMPAAERDLFVERVQQAVGLVWKAMGWHPADKPLSFTEADETAWPSLPKVVIKWDEATCAQMVWLYSEIISHFGGRPEEFIRTTRHPWTGEERDARTLRIASIDIGGGTTDLVITDYALDSGQGANVALHPIQRFRDGFKVAGDDIELEVIQYMLIPAIEAALREYGIAETRPLLHRLMGAEGETVQDKVLRQQLTLQVLHPLALAVLAAYEMYDPVAGAETQSRSFGEILGEARPSPEVMAHVVRTVRAHVAPGLPEFDLMSVRLPLDLHRLHNLFLSNEMEICKTIRVLCEIVHLHSCDVLLATGRPSRLPGVQALFRALLPLPPSRIVPLHGYHAGAWYPLGSQDRIADPKTTAAVGATLSLLCAERRIPNFFVRTNAFSIPSTIRVIGLVDRNMTIRDEDVYFHGIELDDPDYQFPEIAFEMRGPMTIGFRQLDAARWPAAPLYRLDFAEDSELAARARKAMDAPSAEGSGGFLRVTLKRARARGRNEALSIDQVTTADGGALSPRSLSLSLCTLNTVGLEETGYWLDSGSIVR